MHGLSCRDPQGSSWVTTANGFQIEFPYLPEDSYRAKKSLFIDSPNSVNLYELVVPPNYQNLFFIGIAELPYAPPFSQDSFSRDGLGLFTNEIFQGPAATHLRNPSTMDRRNPKQEIQSSHTLTNDQINRTIPTKPRQARKTPSFLRSPPPFHSIASSHPQARLTPPLVRPLRPPHSQCRLPPLRRPSPASPPRKPLLQPPLP
jgi:hypothetical protein